MNTSRGIEAWFARARSVLVPCLLGLFVTGMVHAQQQETPSCEGMAINKRAMALCDAFFEALGCGGGLQREELRCHRLGQEFEHQTGIPHELLPGLAGTQQRFDLNGGQLALGDLLVIELAPESVSAPMRLSARLAPRQHSHPWFEELDNVADRAVFDIRISAGQQPPPLISPADLEINMGPFMDSMADVQPDHRFQVMALGVKSGGAGEPALGVVPLGEPLARGEGPVRLSLAMSPDRFIRHDKATGGDYQWLISIVRLKPDP